VVTFKNDLSRSGQNLTESVLTPTNVNSSTFGLLRNLKVDGKVDAQPLYLSKLNIGTATQNVVFVATEADSVYAFDADTGNPVWHVSLLGSGETLSDSHGCNQVVPNIGITSTPVIDRGAGPHGVLYAVAMSKDASGNYHQRLHALDVTTGAELFNGPAEISATYSAAGNTTSFEPGQYAERAALLLSNGVIYTTWTSHCDFPPYSGWIIGYDQNTLAQTGVLNIGPNSNAGPSIWMSGDGPAADAAGNIYLLSANGAFEPTLDANGFPNQQDYGNSFLRIAVSSGKALSVADYFTLSNEVAESSIDEDLGSGGEMLLPDLTDSGGTVRHLMVGAGKDGTVYVVNRDSMGKFNSSTNNIWQQLTRVLPGGIFSSPAFFNGTVYYADSGGSLKAFPITNARLGGASPSQSLTQFPFPGASPAVSANGTANGIVWAHENSSVAVLHAYDASNLTHELYNSNQAGSRDHFGAGNKFITPTIADGKVFVGSQNSVAVFGLLQ
jgi:outer membrane protein assembly factor BamB